MSLIKKLFGSKGEKFYLELEETATEAAEQAKKQINKVTEAQPIQNATKTATELVQEAKKQVDKVTETQPVENAAKTAKKVARKSKKQVDRVTKTQPVENAAATAKKVVEDTKQQVKSTAPTKKTPAKKSQTTKPDQQPATVANNGASSWEQPFWIKAMYNNNNSSNGKAASSQETFATDNLMPTVTKYRRRPGPSLTKFKDMASKAKTPRG
jgi:hypothetical protein